ncbi:hypothetical protein HDU98_003232, partial [Podochytrium sp. JEL0797]
MGLQGKFDAAKEVLAGVKTTVDEYESKAATDDEVFASRRVRVRYLLEMGRVINSGGNAEGSISPFRTAMQISRLGALDNPASNLSAYTADAIHMLGIVDTEHKVTWNVKGISMCEKSKDPATKKWLAVFLNNQ